MTRLLLLTSSVLSFACASAQLMVYEVADPAAMALTHLNGPNVLLSNAFSQTINPQQVGVFSDSTSSIGLDSGLVISTGICYGVLGPNDIPNMTFGGGYGMYDPDLYTMSILVPSATYDPGIIQMDLIPEGDTLEIRYVFGSEEYDEYACSDKDDRMGLFLSGPGLSGPFMGGAVNIALLPATGLPVTVNTLNRGINGSEGNVAICGFNPTWLADTIYYINNDFGTGTQLDGYSVVLTARSVVVPGALYHLKIAIADVADGNFDSAVFLPEGAISCTELSTGTPSMDRSAAAFWLNEQDRTVRIRGLSAEDGPVLVEAFDPAGRLLDRSMAMCNGDVLIAPLGRVASGLVLVRASQDRQTICGKVFLP